MLDGEFNTFNGANVAPTTCIANKREGNIVLVAAEGHRAKTEGGYFYASIAEQFVIHDGFLYL